VAAVVLVAFVTALDNTLLTVAAATIGQDLSLSAVAVERVGTAYLLPFAVLLLAGGRIADRWGRAETLLVGVVVFSLSSVVAAVAPNGDVLIAARALQGVGGAFLLPATLAVVATDLDGSVRRMAAGMWTAAIAVALSVGPVAGGVMTQLWGWRSVFALNLLAAVPAGVAVVLSVPRRRAAAGRTRLGLPSLLAATVALIAGVDALLEWRQAGLRPVATATAAVVALFLFLRFERRGAQPLLPRRVWSHPVFAGGTVAQVMWGLGINGVFFFTPLYLQNVLGLGPAATGLMFLPVAVTVAVAVPIAGRAADRYSAAAVSAFGLALTAVGLAAVAVSAPDSGAAGLVPGLLVIGFGSGLTTPLVDRVLSVMPPDSAGAASGVVSAARELSGALGIAVVGLVLAWHIPPEELHQEVLGPGFLVGYRQGLMLAAVVVALAAPVAGLMLRERRGAGSVAEPTPVAPVLDIREEGGDPADPPSPADSLR
jgi:EmrB/QacA subfamily drug resistance transporter